MKVQHATMKSNTLTVSDSISIEDIQFDENGQAEVDNEVGERLLEIPGITEYKVTKKGRPPKTTEADDKAEATKADDKTKAKGAKNDEN